MIVRFRRGNMTETRPVHGKLDHHVSAGRKRDGYKQLPVSVEFTKYGNTLFRPVNFSNLHSAAFVTVLHIIWSMLTNFAFFKKTLPKLFYKLDNPVINRL